MLKFPPWKVGLVLGVVLLGLLTAFPNILSEERARDLPDFLPNNQINLGLDLQGGSHMLLEIDTQAVISDRLANLEASIRQALRQEQIIANLESLEEDRRIRVNLRDAGTRETATQRIRDLATPVDTGGAFGGGMGGGQQRNIAVDAEGENAIRVRLTEAAINNRIGSAVEQSLEIVRRRIDELGTREPTIQRQGFDRILVQVPGLQSSQQLRDILETTAQLTFHLVNESADPERPPPGFKTYPNADTGGRIVVERRVRISGENLTDAQVAFNQQNQPVVSFTLDTTGGRKFANLTQEHQGERFAIVLDNEVISAPVIREPIPGGRGQISGNFTVESANNLAILLRAGALPAPLNIIQERTIGPGLGSDSVRAGKIAAAIGLVAVVAFVIVAYGRFGLIADLALLANLALIVGALSSLGATLTLPGIAGIVLTIGMAVDANVLIFERIREEGRQGRGPLRAVEAGYEQAMSTVMDANITTFIAAFLLFQFGSGPVKGFAVTLGIGILTSLFSAVMFTRLLLVVWLRRSRPDRLPI